MSGDPRTEAASVRHRMPRYMPALIFAAAALLAVLPLIVNGASCGHDFDFHLLSWMEAASQWHHGILKPVWAFTPAYNAGEPRLLLYPPLSWSTGAMLGMLLPWKAVPIAFTWLVLVLCGACMYRLLSRWTTPGTATLGGCLYLVNPYMLFVAYERTAYAELLAAAWMPLLLAAILRNRISVFRLALVVALLWLTNAPAAVVGCYSILLLGTFRLVLILRRDGFAALRFAGSVTAGVLLGLLVDAFYLIPMINERRFVQLDLAVVPMARPDANFLFAWYENAFHYHVLQQASWIGVSEIATGLLCGALLLRFNRSSRGVHAFRSMHARDTSALVDEWMRTAVIAMTIFSGAILFLLSRWSTPVWHIAPEMIFLQFPWRFLTIQSAVSIALLALLLQRLLGRVPWAIPAATGIAIALLAGYFAGGRYFREECGDDETVQAQRAAYLNQDGTDPTDEYTPVDADNDELHLHLPLAYLANEADRDPGKGPALVSADPSHPEDLRFVTPALAQPEVMVVRLRAFPGWHTFRDGTEIAADARPDGLIVIPLPIGASHNVRVVYRTTWDQWAGLGTTGVVLVACGWIVRRKRSGIMNYPA